MDFAADFTAIDFETANQRPDSACQLAAVIVRGGRIVDQAKWLIRPEPCYFSRTNIRIHGITPQQVRGEATFGELWPDIAAKLDGDCVVAHNASFDIGVLLACLRSHEQTIPELEFACTRAIARRTWPQHRRYGLKPLSNWLGIRFRHHDALEDSIACAKILLAAGTDKEAKSLPDLEKRLRLSRGKAGPWGQRSPSGRKRALGEPANRSQAPAVSSASMPFLVPGQRTPTAAEPSCDFDPGTTFDLQRLMIRAEFIRPLSGMQIVFAGRLRLLSRQQAENLANQLGGTCQQKVDATTDVLVIGQNATDCVQQLQSTNGKTVRVVTEDEFLGFVVAAD